MDIGQDELEARARHIVAERYVYDRWNDAAYFYADLSDEQRTWLKQRAEELYHHIQEQT